MRVIKQHRIIYLWICETSDFFLIRKIFVAIQVIKTGSRESIYNVKAKIISMLLSKLIIRSEFWSVTTRDTENSTVSAPVMQRKWPSVWLQQRLKRRRNKFRQIRAMLKTDSVMNMCGSHGLAVRVRQNKIRSAWLKAFHLTQMTYSVFYTAVMLLKTGRQNSYL